MNAGLRAEIADLLQAAYQSRVPVEPLTERYPELTLADAVEIQLIQIRRRVVAGAQVRGHKVGLTSLAMQRQMGVDQPDYGHLLGDMFWPENEPIPVAEFLQPRAEPELAFVLRRPLRGPGVTEAEAAAAVDFVLPALELIDSRIRDWRIGLLDTIADNASSAGVVLGSSQAPLAAIDVRRMRCELYRGGELAGSGTGDAVLGSPINSLMWLANKLAEQDTGLDAGHVVLPGSITASIPVAAGDTVTAGFGGLGTVTARFSGEGL